MPNENLNQVNPEPIAFIFSENLLLSQKISQALTILKCKTFVFTRKPLGNSAEFVEGNNLSIDNVDEIYNKHKPNYIIKITQKNELTSPNEGEVFTKVLNISSQTQAKTIFTFPYGLPEKYQNIVSNFVDRSLKYENLYIGFLYIGDILNENSKDLDNPEIFEEIRTIYDGDIEKFNKRAYYPVFIDDLVSEILKELLSINLYGGKLALTSEPVFILETIGNLNIDRLTDDKQVGVDNTRYPKVEHKKISHNAPHKLKEEIVKFTNELVKEKALSGSIKSSLDKNVDEEEKQEQFLKREVKKKVVEKPVNKDIKSKGKNKVRWFKTPKFKKFKEINRDISFHTWDKIPKIEKENVPKSVKDKFTDLQNNAQRKETAKNRTKSTNIKKKTIKRLFKLLALLLLVIFLPSILNLFVGFLNFTTGKLISKGKYQASQNIAGFSQAISNMSKVQSLYLKDIGFFDSYYNYEFDKSVKYSKISEINKHLSQSLIKISNIITSDKNLSTELETYKEVGLNLNNIYQDLGFLEGEVSDKEKYFVLYSKILGINTDNLREKVYLLSKLFLDSDYYLGYKDPIYYAVVLEDSGIIRPNGGKITAVALIKVLGGRTEEINIYGVNYLDSRLEGVVEAPDSLNKYFGLEEWQLGEANWYIDNQKTYKEIAWFLDKEIDVDVNVVITLNTKLLDDYIKKYSNSETIKEGNINEFRIDSDDENIISALVDLTRFFPIKKGNSEDLIKNIFEAFNKRDITLYSYSQDENKILEELGWGGKYNRFGNCDNCEHSLNGFFEAGTERMQEALVRKGELEISIEENLVKKKYKYFIENPNTDTYKVYLRQITEKGSGISPVLIYSEENKEENTPIIYGYDDYKEVGVYLEIEPKATKAVVFEWEDYVENLKDKEGYNQTIIKQPGIPNYPLDIIINNPADFDIRLEKDYSLTEEGAFVYNTEVVGDMEFIFYW